MPKIDINGEVREMTEEEIEIYMNYNEEDENNG